MMILMTIFHTIVMWYKKKKFLFLLFSTCKTNRGWLLANQNCAVCTYFYSIRLQHHTVWLDVCVCRFLERHFRKGFVCISFISFVFDFLRFPFHYQMCVNLIFVVTFLCVCTCVLDERYANWCDVLTSGDGSEITIFVDRATVFEVGGLCSLFPFFLRGCRVMRAHIFLHYRIAESKKYRIK